MLPRAERQTERPTPMLHIKSFADYLAMCPGAFSAYADDSLCGGSCSNAPQPQSHAPHTPAADARPSRAVAHVRTRAADAATIAPSGQKNNT